MFVDRVKIHVKGGDGGDGKVSFYRAKYITHGGPDGGDGGKGGNVVFVGESGMSTLMDFRYKRKFVATPGEPGGKRNCFGKDGEDIIIKVPVGTVIREAESGKVMADITTAGEEKILIHGGKGGKGNQHFATPTRQAPRYAEPGRKSKEYDVILELKLIADVGLIGFPKMGVTGAAVATVIGQCVGALVSFTCNHKFNPDVRLQFRGFRPDGRIIRTIYAIGIPSIIMQSIGSVMTYSMNRILITFSSTATAVFGVYFKLQSFFFMPVFGLNNGITPIIAFNYGAQNRKRMVKTIKLSMATAFCIMLFGFLCFELVPQVLLGMFNASADMLTIGVPALRIIGIHYLLAWFGIICGTVFQALGKAVFSMIVSIMRQLVVLIPAAYVLAKFGGLHAV